MIGKKDGEKMVFEAICDECSNTLESGEKVYCNGCYDALIDEFEELEQKLTDKEYDIEAHEEKISDLEEKISELENRIKELEGE